MPTSIPDLVWYSIPILLGIIAWFIQDGFSGLKQQVNNLAKEVRSVATASQKTDADFRAHLMICRDRHRWDGPRRQSDEGPDV